MEANFDNGLKINVTDAIIKSMEVQIKSLTLNRKQMTLAVFRQIITEDIFDNDLNLKGKVWGLVNYHTSKCNFKKHIHIVWQKENELRKDEIYFDYNIYNSKFVDRIYTLDRDLELIKKDFLHSSYNTAFKNRYNVVFEEIDWKTKPEDKPLIEKRNMEKIKYIKDSIISELVPLKSAFAETYKKYDDQIKKIAKMDHLFIAV